LVFATDREGSVDLFSIRWDGTELTQITSDPGIDCRPRWSRDGQWILFTSNRSGNFDLFVTNPTGDDVRQLTTDPSPDDHADWSPDGQTIAFVSMRAGSFDIYRMPVPTDLKIGERLVPTRSNPQPQSKGLVAHYTFDRESESEKVVVDMAGRNQAQLVDAKIVRNGNRGRLFFDGVKSYAICGNGESLRIQNALTISLWVKPSTMNGNHYLVSKQGWNLYLGGGGIPNFETRTAKDDAWDTLSGKAPAKAGEWTQVVAVHDPNAKKLSLYVNGQMTAEKPRLDGALGAATGFTLELGHYNQSRNQKFAGDMDEVRFYSRALTATEITEEYNKQKPVVIEQ
ncbi:MAG: hypothetical protein FJ267_04500, partial [Planctomycetes bacterium]|nr:hypothetical protein [Planctomycetota bacterium]